MTPARWQQVKALMAAALSVSPAERIAFVEGRTCDDDVRREVLSLLQAHEAAGEFLEPCVAEPATSAEKSERDLAGTRIGAYELVREIGRGGMGVVYLAVRADKEFRRRVAIKLMRGGMESDSAIRRFRNERQILAQLDHPNIARLLDGGTTPEGSPYFVMEYIEGEPFLQHCRERCLDIRQSVAIFQRVCAAVQYAHRRMIVHRDLKPGNVLVEAEGNPKLLDFGIAKVLDPGPAEARVTQTGVRLLTPAYASPEQLRGESATTRSDIYSLGILLWELVSGVLPGYQHGQRSFEMPDAAPDDPSLPLIQNIRNIAIRATREAPEERYESLDTFASDLESALAGCEISSIGISDALHADAVQLGSVAVLPFQILGREGASDTYLGIGITDALITRLSNVGRISVRPTDAVTKFSGKQDAVEAGHELKVQYVLEGHIQRTTDRVRVTVQLVEVRAKTPVWAGSFDEQFEDLLKLEDSLSSQVAQALVPHMTGDERKGLARPGTASAKAHQAYLRGRWYWSQFTEDALPQALVLFSEAAAEDPGYARAHAGIADYHIAVGVWGILPSMEAFAAAMQSARRAIELDPKLAEAHASLGLAAWIHDGDYETATHEFQLAIALNPDYAPAHDWFGLLSAALGRHEMAVASIDRARRLDPLSGVYAADLAFCHYNARRYENAVAAFGAQLAPVVNCTALPLSLLHHEAAPHHLDQALAAARRVVDVMGRNPTALAVLAQTHAASGDHAAASLLLDELKGRARDYYVPGTALALASLACGHKEDALRHLERASAERDWWTLFLGVMPAWDELRTHSRFQRMLKAKRTPRRAGVPRARSRVGIPAAWIAAAVLTLAGVFLYPRLSSPPAPFLNARISRLTTNGIAERAAISPDGNLVAFSSRQEGRVSVWVRSLKDSSTYQIAGPYEGLLPTLQFTRNGAHVAFVNRPVNDPSQGVLYIVPAAGGAAVAAMTGVAQGVGVSPDESQFAYYRSNSAIGSDELVVKEAGRDGRERVIETRRHPEVFVECPAPAWSPDGRYLAVAVQGPHQSGYGIRLHVINRSGSIQNLVGPAFSAINDIAWLSRPQGLLVAGQDLAGPFFQVWRMTPGSDTASRITHDLNQYTALGVDANASALVGIQVQTVTNLYVMREDDPEHPRQITPGGGRYFDVEWTPAGDLLYASDSTGAAEIWTMAANGTGQRQVTSGIGRSYAPAASPDGKTIAFHSNRGGVWNIWKVGADGGAPAQLTYDSSDSTYPRFTPDGAAVVYQHLGTNALQNIWKTPLAGGTPVQLTRGYRMYPAIASDGRLAAWFCEDVNNQQWQIAIYRPGSDTPQRVFSFPGHRMPDVLLRWMPAANAISYIENQKGVSNIWIQPIDSGPARQLTRFTSGRIYSFDWSADGRLAFSRGMTTSDVVLLRDENR